MPELPEVETTVRDLRPKLRGSTITGARVHWKRTIAFPSTTHFIEKILGTKIKTITRRGKYLVFHLSQAGRAGVKTPHSHLYLLVHLRMTGGFSIELRGTMRDKHEHVVIELNHRRELRFRDTRKFGRMWLVDDPARVTGKLGPEPLEITAREFSARLKERHGYLKPLLLNQEFLAGVGNIYADESLWYARLHPLHRAETLTNAERIRLYRAIRGVLTRAIAVGGTSIDVMYKRVNGASGGFQNSLRAFDRESHPCRRCGAIIQKTVVGQRGTHFCPGCQW